MQDSDRIKILEEILLELHHGASPESVQERFNQHFKGVSAIEIALMEHQLINDPTNPITFADVLELCNVHARLFDGAVEDSDQRATDLPGHPIRVYKNENAALRSALIRIDNLLTALADLEPSQEPGILRGLRNQYRLIGQFDRHYQRKERLFFPFMEKNGHTAPPKVMWAKDDEIRDLYQQALTAINQLPDQITLAEVQAHHEAFSYELTEMIFKEEAILFNILLETLTTQEWYQIAQESDTYGYTIVPPEAEWNPEEIEHGVQSPILDPPVSNPHTLTPVDSYQIQLPTGRLLVHFDAPEETPLRQYTHRMSRPFAHGGLTGTEIALLLAYIPWKIYLFDDQHQLQYTNNATEFTSRSYQSVLSSTSSPIIENWLAGDQETLIHSTDDAYQQCTKLYHEGAYVGWIYLIESLTPLRQLPTNKRELSPIPADLPAPLTNKLPNTTALSPQIETQQLALTAGTVTITHLPDSSMEDPELNQPLTLDGGMLTLAQINAILNALPGEITIVDREHIFRYYNDAVPSAEMLFKRTPAQINRELEYCHPPRIWPKVQTLVAQLQSGDKLNEAMTFQPHSTSQIYVHYIALRDRENQFQGILEIVRDIYPLLHPTKDTPS